MGNISWFIYADDVNILGENLQTIRENTEIFIKASNQGTITLLTVFGTYRAMACRERELDVDHLRLFLPHKYMECLPRWVMSQMPGPPPRQHEH